MNEPKSVRYQRLMRRAQLADVSVGLGWLAVLAFSPASRWLADLAWAGSRWCATVLQPLAAAAGFLLLLVLAWEAFSFPVALYFGLHMERRFGRAEQTARAVIAAQLRASWIGTTGALVLSAILAVTIIAFGPLWWLAAGVLSAAALALALHLVSALLVRLGRTRPIARRTLLSGLREIARRSGVPVSDILEWQVAEGARATALVAGIGRTRRVLIASEVVRDWSDDEIAVVVAHELAHHVHHDLWRALALDALVLSLAFWIVQVLALGPAKPTFGDPSDLGVLPLLAFIVAGVWIAATPLRLGQSRAQERRADRFALDLTGEAAAFVAAIRRLGARHLAEEQPSRLARWFFYRHPPVTERIEDAERFGRYFLASTTSTPDMPLQPGSAASVHLNGKRPGLSARNSNVTGLPGSARRMMR